MTDAADDEVLSPWPSPEPRPAPEWVERAWAAAPPGRDAT